MDVRELMGKAVVALDEAERLGRVTDVALDTARLRIAGVRVSDGQGSYVLPFDQISSIGPDAITVETQGAVRRSAGAAGLAQFPGMSELTNMKVVDETGTYQGTIEAVHADPESGEVISLDLATGGVMGLGAEHDSVSVAAIRGVGRDVVTVGSDAARGSDSR